MVYNAIQVVFPLVGMVALGWFLIIVGFGIETNEKLVIALPADLPVRYSWWIVILVTPGMLIMAVVQAAIDNNRLVMNIIGAIVSYFYIIIIAMVASAKLSRFIFLNSCIYNYLDNFSQCSVSDWFRLSADQLWRVFKQVPYISRFFYIG